MKWQIVFEKIIDFGEAHPFIWMAVTFPYLIPTALISWIRFRKLSKDKQDEIMKEYRTNIESRRAGFINL